MIRVFNDKTFVLDTKNTTYAFELKDTGHLEHLYYGKGITLYDSDGLAEQKEFIQGNTNVVDDEHKNMTLEDIKLEMSSLGKGDIREPMIEVVNPDGSRTSDFRYESYEIAETKEESKDLPSSYGDAKTLTVTLKDKNSGLRLDLKYYVFEAVDVISRAAVLENLSPGDVRIDRLMSTLVDFDRGEYTFHTFTGAWAREMNKTDIPVVSGKYINSSITGTSSSRANPFVMLSKKNACEDYGWVYGFNLIYSGNHYECCEVSPYGKVRFVAGINPTGFEWTLKPGEKFETPEAVMCFSDKGFNGMSSAMHDFVNSHIVRGAWKERLRPVLLNSWEAAYFDISERKLLKLAKKAAQAGIELFVMDDGWFGQRNDDTSSLGDWYPNKKKLPKGLKGICDKIKKLGMDFGIWVEPEMVSENSDLYRTHPDWAIKIPGKDHSKGRNQLILDLTRTEVQDYIIDAMSKVFSSADISYVKWDMNRTFTDFFSGNLENQGEVFHRYCLGLYRVMRTLTSKFPEILFEGCAAGGNRFDLGILCYFPQIWASDDSDAVCRAEIQNSYSYGYPQSTYTAHVSDCPNHQTLRVTPIETRFNVAAFAVLGYECNLCDMNKEEFEAVKTQIEYYKDHRRMFQYGNFRRVRDFKRSLEYKHGSMTAPGVGHDLEWCVVSEDQSEAVSMIMQLNVTPNSQFCMVTPKGLSPSTKYLIEGRILKYNIKFFGSLINTSTPFHVKPEGHLVNIIAKFVKMDGEVERHIMYGDAMMNAGVHLKSAFAGVGYNNEVRFFPDFASRIYSIKETN